MLAAALGRHLSDAFGGRIDWFRSAAWGFHTLSKMLALRFGTAFVDGRPAWALYPFILPMIALMWPEQRIVKEDSR